MEVLEGATTVERSILDHARQTKTPANGSIEITPLCNMNCDMCYVRLSPEQMAQQGRLRTGQEWLTVGRQMRDAGVLFLLITGGEPLTHPDFKEIYLGMQQLGMIVTVNTNGTLIDEQWTAFFAEHKPRRINITLYGADAEAYYRLCHYPDGFERTLHAIQLLKQQGVDVKVSSSLTRANQADWEKVIHIGEKLGVPVREDTYMCPATRERNMPYNQQSRMSPEEAGQVRIKLLRAEMGDELFYQSAAFNLYRTANTQVGDGVPQPMKCMAGSCSFSINWQGHMRPCVISTAPEVDVFSVGFTEAWNDIVAETAKLHTSSQCAKCTLRQFCNNCVMYSLYECGRHDGVPDYICRYTRASLRAMAEEYRAMTAEYQAAQEGVPGDDTTV